MTLRVIGAGLGRTGTFSLKLALERLLGQPCYHMHDVFMRPQDVPVWLDAAEGRMPDWEQLFDGYAAAVDWPASAYWHELSAVFPDAIIVHSVRDSEAWWRSTNATIFPVCMAADRETEWGRMIHTMMANRFISALDDREACIAAFGKHNDRVRALAPATRLVEWRPTDGWEPLCRALGVDVPEEPFPVTNSTEEFVKRLESR